MFAKSLSTALVSAMLLTGAMQTASFAEGCGGGDAPINAYSQPSATAHKRDGSSITVRGNRDGSRTIFHRNAKGKVVKKQRIAKNKKVRKPKKHSRPWASAYDPATHTRTTSVGLNQKGSVRAVIAVGPFGLSFGISR